MRYLKTYKIFENLNPEKILWDISLDLSDEGLYVSFPEDRKFGDKFYLCKQKVIVC